MTMHRNHAHHWTDRGRMRQQSSQGDQPPVDTMWQRDIGFSSMSWAFPPFPPGHPGANQETPPSDMSMAPMLPIMPPGSMMALPPTAFTSNQPMIMPPPFQNPSNFMFPPFADFMIAQPQPLSQPPIEHFPHNMPRITAVTTPSPPDTPQEEQEQMRLATEKSIADAERQQKEMQEAAALAEEQRQREAQRDHLKRMDAELERWRKQQEDAAQKAEADAKQRIDRAAKAAHEADAAAAAAEQYKKEWQAAQRASYEQHVKEQQEAETERALEESRRTAMEEEQRRLAEELSRKQAPQPTVKTTETGTIYTRFAPSKYNTAKQPVQNPTEADHQAAIDLQHAYDLQAALEASRAENHTRRPYTTETFIERKVTPIPRNTSPRPVAYAPRSPTPPTPCSATPPAQYPTRIRAGEHGDITFSADEGSDDEFVHRARVPRRGPPPNDYFMAGGASRPDRGEERGHQYEEHLRGTPTENERHTQRETVYLRKERPRGKKEREYVYESDVEVRREGNERGRAADGGRRTKVDRREVRVVTPEEQERGAFDEREMQDPRLRRRSGSPHPKVVDRRVSPPRDVDRGRGVSPFDRYGRKRIQIRDPSTGQLREAYIRDTPNGPVIEYAPREASPRRRAPPEQDEGRRRDLPRPALVRREQPRNEAPERRRQYGDHSDPGFLYEREYERRVSPGRSRGVARAADDETVRRDESRYYYKRDERNH